MSASMLTFQKEKEAYWQMRDELLKTHLHQWVAISEGIVIAEGSSLSQVMDLATQRTLAEAMYINKVGDEDTALRKRIRRVESAYYRQDYDPSLPMLSAELTNPKQTARTRVDLSLIGARMFL